MMPYRLLHPDWSGESVFQETKLIVGAQLQIITFRDWLPMIIGKEVRFKKMITDNDFHLL